MPGPFHGNIKRPGEASLAPTKCMYIVKGGESRTLIKNLLEWLEIKYLKPTIALAEEVNDNNYREKLDEIEIILKDALAYVQTLKK